jgi:predicted RNA polymerase sigma factor
MIDQAKASRLAREAFDLWQSGRHEEAADRYQQALAFVDQDHDTLADYHQEFAAVLAELGRDAEALEQYRRAIAVSQRQEQDEDALSILIARYFLSEQLLRMNKLEDAIAESEPLLHSKMRWLAHVVRSDALWKLGRCEESRAEADLALSQADSQKQRENIQERLSHVVNA